MIRVFQYQITSGTTILDYLHTKGYTHRILARLKRTENGICVRHAGSAGAVWSHVSEELFPGDELIVSLYEKEEGPHPPVPVKLPVHVVYEDQDILVVDKAAGMPVHPSPGNRDNTLANALTYHYRQPEEAFTCRIIDRLDKDTTGLLIVARNALAAAVLCGDMKMRKICRTYLAVTENCFEPGNMQGIIDAPIARRDGSAIERCVDYEKGESAVTRYRVLSQSEETKTALVKIQLETGRTHQIRVHMSSIGHPLVGDTLYNPRERSGEAGSRGIGRQALHSWRLSFHHPMTGDTMDFEQPLPEDMRTLAAVF